MFKLWISLFMIILSSIMIFLNHPLSMGMMILLQTILLSILSGMLIKTYWFSYILMLTFLGGLLVLFIYVSMIMLSMIFIIILISNNFNKSNLFFNNEMNNFIYMNFFNNENKMNISKLYNNQTYLIMMIMIIYLFITLLAIVKITNIFQGTLRSNNM